MALDEIRTAIALLGGGSGQINYTLKQGVAFRVEAISFRVDLSGAAGAADIKVRFRTATGVPIVGAMVGSAQAAGSVVTYTLSASLNPCDSWADAADKGTPDTWPDVALIEGCSVAIDCSDPTTGVEVAGAVIADALLWVEPLAGAAGEPAIPLLTPILLAEQTAAPV